ncbi:secreted phosphoprotein 24-like [Clarias gariepinus]|uniref:secreted phosphoprotein 24-like n=1 Tax=Clarias gariepinus TaxID=13013 RepID=UPI00234C3E80|nr:secreted phosphoprotein 24-like [Clarias gariepinus]
MGKTRSTLIMLIFLQCHCVSGWVLWNINLAADSALLASVAKMNERSLTYNLYRATYKAVSQIKLVDFNTYDLTLNFGVRETMCLKPLAVAPDRCQFKWSLYMPEHKCRSYVRVSGGFISLRGVSCSVHPVSSSSEEDILVVRDTD